MATTKPAAAPTSPPAASTASSPVKDAPAPAKKLDFGRPFRYAFGFVTGTVRQTLDGLSNGGRKGMWLGVGIGLIAAVTLGAGLGAIVMGWAGGLVVGAATGGALGLVTGGARGIGREVRKTKYSEDLMMRAREKSAPTPAVDYRQAHHDYQQQSNYAFDRFYQQQRETSHETNRYFQDHVERSRMEPHHHEHGF